MVSSQIKHDTLHIWWANLREFDLAVPAMWSVLSPWERARAGRFHFLRDKDNYIIRHGMLRMLLGAYAGQSPADLDITIGAYGKPELRNGHGESKIHFNHSHSADMALYGFTGACPLGVDVESVRPIPQYERIAREFFSQAESEKLMDLAEESRTEYFFDLWTRKEALVKAMGTGLGSAQAARYASLPEPESSDLMGSSPGASDEWNIRSFSPREGYVAAVAFQKPNLKLICNSTPGFFSEELRTSERNVLQTQTGT